MQLGKLSLCTLFTWMEALRVSALHGSLSTTSLLRLQRAITKISLQPTASSFSYNPRWSSILFLLLGDFPFFPVRMPLKFYPTFVAGLVFVGWGQRLKPRYLFHHITKARIPLPRLSSLGFYVRIMYEDWSELYWRHTQKHVTQIYIVGKQLVVCIYFQVKVKISTNAKDTKTWWYYYLTIESLFFYPHKQAFLYPCTWLSIMPIGHKLDETKMNTFSVK